MDNNEWTLSVTKVQGELLEIMFNKLGAFKRAESELLDMLDNRTEPLTSQELTANYLMGSIYVQIGSYENADQRFRKIVLNNSILKPVEFLQLVDLIIGVYDGRQRHEEGYWKDQKEHFLNSNIS